MARWTRFSCLIARLVCLSEAWCSHGKDKISLNVSDRWGWYVHMKLDNKAFFIKADAFCQELGNYTPHDNYKTSGFFPRPLRIIDHVDQWQLGFPWETVLLRPLRTAGWCQARQANFALFEIKASKVEQKDRRFLLKTFYCNMAGSCQGRRQWSSFLRP